MAEIKHNFAGGKMNKDLDERLVPNGEYRDAVNIQVSTSEGSDVGAIENLLGNKKVVDGLTLYPPSLSTNASCIGSIADEKNDAFYWFVRENGAPADSPRDIIFQYKNGFYSYVFVDIEKTVLKFPPASPFFGAQFAPRENIITGINIIDDLLFWTDNNSEPKVINIPRSISGTDQNGTVHTNFTNPTTGVSVPAEEKHITVIKKSPKTVLTVETESTSEHAFGLTVSDQSFLNASGLVNVSPGDIVQIEITYDANSPSNLPVNIGDRILLKDSQATVLPPFDSSIVVRLTQKISSNPNTVVAGVFHVWEASVISIENSLGTAAIEYVWATQDQAEYSFLEKFPRFSYRYKYIDNEYSTFGPFTNVIFSPGEFAYDVKDAFNLGMENKITKITLRGYNSNVPEGVVSIDLLYKESNSPTVHLIDTIHLFSNFSSYVNLGYEVKPNMIKAVVPENQLLRHWDNVPRKALAQDVVGNRIVYGNYLQNYTGNGYKVSGDLTNRSICDIDFGKKSLKSIRNYSLGISYLDKYGRQTPVFTNKAADVYVPIQQSLNQNQIVAQPLSNPPNWATHYKVFVKETSNEYYNLALDRVYEAKDGNVWLSFPSSDRNKIDEETFLIMKKGLEDKSITEKNRYKILAIENEAPDFIKTNLKFLTESAQNGSTSDIFPYSGAMPFQGIKRIAINKGNWDAAEIPITDINDEIQVEFTKLTSSGLKVITSKYDVISFNEDTSFTPGAYVLNLEKAITTADGFMPDATTSTDVDITGTIRIYRKLLKQSPEFDGRFFVKIKRNALMTEEAMSFAISQNEVVPVVTMPFYYISDPDSINAATTRPDGSVSNSDSLSKWEDNLKFGTGTLRNGWFIDSARYKSYLEDLDEKIYGLGIYSVFPSLTYPGMAMVLPTSTSASAHNYEYGYNKGIFTDASTGKHYMDLSFSAIEPDLHDGYTTLFEDFSIDAWNSTSGPDLELLNTGFLQGLSAEWWDTNFWDKNKFGGFAIGSQTFNPVHQNELAVIQMLVNDQQFRFIGDPGQTLYTIIGQPEKRHHINGFGTRRHTDPNAPISVTHSDFGGSTGEEGCFAMFANNMYSYGQSAWLSNCAEPLAEMMQKYGKSYNRRTTYRVEISANPTDANSTFNPIATGEADATNDGAIEFIEHHSIDTDGQLRSDQPPIFETEPKNDIDLDIYYETDSAFPLTINNDTNYDFAPIGTIVTLTNDTSGLFGNKTVVSWDDNILELDSPIGDGYANPGYGQELVFHRKDGSCVSAMFVALAEPITTTGGGGTPMSSSFHVEIDPNVSKRPVNLSWFNCYSFNNGVESNRIRDDYNRLYIDKGAKASSTIDEPYEEEHRKYGLIYSGLYNSTSGVNNLNQFIAAEKITKDINPIYGSIQKLHARNTDLITLCEDKVLKILANKDAVFNADNSPQLTATNRVLGQTVPFVGEYGISKNPESFASESYRAYFTDKVRGSVMRLSMDGLTPISMHGMKDWFKDNLKLSNTIVGSYDDKKEEYNVTLLQTNEPRWQNGPITVSFREDVKGWVSFKSFVPQNSVSCANEYYTFDKGIPWRHHIENMDRNTFYNVPYNSSVNVLLSQVPGSVKSFTTLNYEGSQTKITPFTTDPDTGLTDGEYWNLNAQNGWYVDKIFTDLETGSLKEFINKEGKWFNYIRGTNVQHDFASNILMNTDGGSTFDQASFAIQGLGTLSSSPVQVSYEACVDSTAFNYDSNATISCGNCCVAVLMGCLEPSSNVNYFQPANTDDGSCIWQGCTCDPITYPDGCTNTYPFPTVAFSYVGNGAYGGAMVAGGGILDDGNCIAAVYGCTDSSQFNFNSLANINETSPTDSSDPCVPVMNGCMIPSASNTNLLANTDNGTCTWYGCLNQSLASNYGYENPLGGANIPWSNTQLNYVTSGSSYGPQDDASCLDGGCMQQGALNYDSNALWNDGSCIVCDFTTGIGGYNGIPITTTTVNATTFPGNNGSITIVSNTQAPYLSYTFELLDDLGGATIYTSYVSGNDTVYDNLPDGDYIVRLTGANGICTYDTAVTVGSTNTTLHGCTDPTACSYNPNANTNLSAMCEWTTCAGCMDPTAIGTVATMGAYNTQTGTATPCTDWTNTVNLACTIQCGDGTDDTDQGDGCCAYPLLPGCMTPTACNYNSNAGIDDSSCILPDGCTDSSATNYDSLANCDDGSCTYVSSVAGCMDSNACNYNPNANSGCTGVAPTTNNYFTSGGAVEYECCVFGYDAPEIGDTTTTDNGGNLVNPSGTTPVFYTDGSGSTQTIKHKMWNSPTTNTALPYGASSFYPVDQVKPDVENDIGLVFSAQDLGMWQYSNGGSIELVLTKIIDNGITVTETTIDTKSFTSSNAFNQGTAYTLDIGNRIGGAHPYMWGPNPTIPTTSGGWIEGDLAFDIYQQYPGGNSLQKQQYHLNIYTHFCDGQGSCQDYGKANSSTDAGTSSTCGTSTVFEFATLSPCDHPGRIEGCMDPTNCLYNSHATCDNGQQCLPGSPSTCHQCTAPTPNSGGSYFCEPQPCSGHYAWAPCDFPSLNGVTTSAITGTMGCETTLLVPSLQGGIAQQNPCYTGYLGPATYNCVSLGNCQPSIGANGQNDGNGAYIGLTSCQANCVGLPPGPP